MSHQTGQLDERLRGLCQWTKRAPVHTITCKNQRLPQKPVLYFSLPLCFSSWFSLILACYKVSVVNQDMWRHCCAVHQTRWRQYCLSDWPDWPVSGGARAQSVAPFFCPRLLCRPVCASWMKGAWICARRLELLTRADKEPSRFRQPPTPLSLPFHSTLFENARHPFRHPVVILLERERGGFSRKMTSAIVTHYSSYSIHIQRPVFLL